MTQAKVFVVDDDAAVRDGISLLCETADLTVECYDGAESFLASYQPHLCGCLVLDVRMGRMGGPELHDELVRRGSLLSVVYLSGHGDIPLTVRAMKAGAVNFLTKPVDGADLLESVQAALLESKRLGSQSAASQTAAERIASLTEREHEVMALLIHGMSNKDVARRLGISHRTVEIHKGRIMHKTGADTLIDLAHIATVAGRHP